jgi:hypothetical protein
MHLDSSRAQERIEESSAWRACRARSPLTSGCRCPICGSQRLDEVRVGQEPHVPDDVRLGRHAVPESRSSSRRCSARPCGSLALGPRLHPPLALVHVQVRRVDAPRWRRSRNGCIDEPLRPDRVRQGQCPRRPSGWRRRETRRSGAAARRSLRIEKHDRPACSTTLGFELGEAAPPCPAMSVHAAGVEADGQALRSRSGSPGRGRPAWARAAGAGCPRRTSRGPRARGSPSRCPSRRAPSRR